MIDTIFYFVENLPFEDYIEQVNNEEIAERTIVFANNQKAIYKGRLKYGSVDDSDIKAALERINEYLKTVPMATSDTIGGVKIGFVQDNTGKRYPVQLDVYGKAFVQVPWEKTEVDGSDVEELRGNIQTIEGKINNILSSLDQYLKEVPVATSTKVGGILTGYISDSAQKRYGVLLDDNNKAFVYVPWVAGTTEGGVPGEQGKPGNYYQQAFKTTTTNEAPNKPSIDYPANSNGWKSYAENTTGTVYIWMCTRLVDYQGNGLSDWEGPWLISGVNGQAGKDGKGIEYVYRLTKTEDISDILNLNVAYDTEIVVNGKKFQDTGFVPEEWTDHPTGIDQENRYEWVGIRTSNDKGKWSRFSGPILWSHYGKNGTDGDGIEYIYLVTKPNEDLPPDLQNNPTLWYDNPTTKEAYQSPEYKGPEGSDWEDDPQDMTEQGQKQWVSVRKEQDKEDGTKEWGRFSTPTLWSYYSKDGLNGVAEGYTINVINLNMPVVTDADGNVESFSDSSEFEVFHNGIKETNYTLSTGEIKISNGSTIEGITVTSSSITKKVSVTFKNVKNFNNVTLTIPVIITPNGASPINTVIKVYGVAGAIGEPGSSINLWTSDTSVRISYDKTTVYPEKIKVGVKITKGDEPQQIKYVEEAKNLGFTFTYYTDDNTILQISVISNEISVPKNAKNITVQMKYNGMTIDSQRINYISDGAPGIGINAVNYNINILSSSLIIDQEADNITGSFLFTVTKQNGTEFTEMDKSPWTESDNERLELTFGGKNFIGVTSVISPNEETPYFTVNINTPIGYSSNKLSNFASIRLISVTDVTLAGVVIPIPFKGEKGDTTVQSLEGVVMRFVNGGTKDKNGTDGEINWSTYVFRNGTNPLTEDNGIKYLDVLLFDGGYYTHKKQEIAEHKPVEGDKNYFDTGTSGEEWTVFSPTSNAAFQAFIAKYGYIENLTAKEVVVTDNNIPVAGITTGEYISTEEENPLNKINRGDIRIWAGEISNSNLNTCPFYVTNKGYLHAEDVQISGSIYAYLLVQNFKSFNIRNWFDENKADRLSYTMMPSEFEKEFCPNGTLPSVLVIGGLQVDSYNQEEPMNYIINLPNPNKYYGQAITFYIQRQLEYINMPDGSQDKYQRSASILLHCNSDSVSNYFADPIDGGAAIELKTVIRKGDKGSNVYYNNDCERYAKLTLYPVNTKQGPKWVMVESTYLIEKDTLSEVTSTNN